MRHSGNIYDLIVTHQPNHPRNLETQGLLNKLHASVWWFWNKISKEKRGKPPHYITKSQIWGQPRLGRQPILQHHIKVILQITNYRGEKLRTHSTSYNTQPPSVYKTLIINGNPPHRAPQLPKWRRNLTTPQWLRQWKPIQTNRWWEHSYYVLAVYPTIIIEINIISVEQDISTHTTAKKFPITKLYGHTLRGHNQVLYQWNEPPHAH